MLNFAWSLVKFLGYLKRDLTSFPVLSARQQNHVPYYPTLYNQKPSTNSICLNTVTVTDDQAIFFPAALRTSSAGYEFLAASTAASTTESGNKRLNSSKVDN